MMKRNRLRSLAAAVMAVCLMTLSAAGLTAFAEEPVEESTVQNAVVSVQEEETAAEETQSAEEAEQTAPESTGEQKKSNPILNAVLVVIVVGAVVICVREIHRDNHRK